MMIMMIWVPFIRSIMWLPVWESIFVVWTVVPVPGSVVVPVMVVRTVVPVMVMRAMVPVMVMRAVVPVMVMGT